MGGGTSAMGTIIKDLPILDLRAISAEAFDKIDRVENVRTVVLSSENAEAFMRVPRVEVRSHLILRPDETLYSGQIEFNDAYLQTLTDNTKLVVLGHTFVDKFSVPLFFTKVQSVRIYGQILYSDAACAGALLSRLIRLQGQLLKMAPDAIRRIGPTFIDRDLLTSISGRNIVSIGTLTVDPRVSAKDITDSIGTMTQIGEIRGQEAAVCALLSVCKNRLGTYSLCQ
jgi:hypothetical protein